MPRKRSSAFTDFSRSEAIFLSHYSVSLSGTGSSYESYPTHQEQPLGSIKYLTYLVALLIPVLGIIWDIVWVLEKGKRAAGRITLMIGVWTFFLGLICLLWIEFPF
jgi:hypothetical protein